MKRFFCMVAVVLCLPCVRSAEIVGVFADPDVTTSELSGDIVGPLRFAALDVQKALEFKGYDVELHSLSELTANYPHKKIVIALGDNAAITSMLVAQKGIAPTGLEDQAYDMQTTSQGATSYWAIGGDERGAMYGGLQLAENIHFEGFAKEQKGRVAPYVMSRGAKLNMALDYRLPTYAGKNDNKTPSIARGVEHVWSMDFWKAWLDQQARNRYNLVSVWTYNPFPALVHVPGFEKSTIDHIRGMAGKLDDDKKDAYDSKDIPGVAAFEDKTMTLEKRQKFWRDVMKYAKKRGFDFYFFNWNMCLSWVDKFYPVSVSHEHVSAADLSNEHNKTYLNAAIEELLKIYPDLTGFGVSPGDLMPKGSGSTAIAKWIFEAYSKGINKFAQENKGRKINFIHRNLKVDVPDVANFWKDVINNNQNLQFDHSLKYCIAYTYSTPTPEWAFGELNDLAQEGQSTYLTLRNDGFYYTDFGDSGFVREFINNLPSRTYDGKIIKPVDTEKTKSGKAIVTPDKHLGKERLRGFYLGHDTYTPTVSYLYKDPELNIDPVTQKPMLEIQRKWLMEMLWGRIGYDKNVSDDVFARGVALRYPGLPVESYPTLFGAWAKASQVNTKLMELVQGAWSLDSHFHTEFCMYKDDGEDIFRKLEDFYIGTIKGRKKALVFPCPADGSNTKLASIKETGEGNKKNKPNDSWKVANLLEDNGMQSLTMLASIPTAGDKRTDAMIKSIQTQAFLSLYYAHKVRGATFMAKGPTVAQNITDARNEMYQAYGWWMHYINAMESLYIPENFRTYALKKLGWHKWDKEVLKEYQDLDATDVPVLPDLPRASSRP